MTISRRIAILNTRYIDVADSKNLPAFYHFKNEKYDIRTFVSGKISG